MKNLIVTVGLLLSGHAFAGGMARIPVQLFEIDNQGRSLFLRNALAELGLSQDQTVSYEKFQSVIVGGDERGSDYKGALMSYSVQVNAREKYQCWQRISVGQFDPSLTNPIECTKL